MATEDFLSCLSRGALETVATAESVNIAPRAKDTRARMVAHFVDGAFVYPGARFQLTPGEQGTTAGHHDRRSTAGWVGPITPAADEGDGVAAPDSVRDDIAGSDDGLREAA